MPRRKRWTAIADGALIAVLFGACYILCLTMDIVWTANRSWLLYDGHFLDFYDYSLAWSGTHHANYLPTTYLLYALWNLPLKLIGVAAPADESTMRLAVNLWYKALPALALGGCCLFTLRIARRLNMGETKSRLCALAFLTAPLAVYAVFIFSQYDVFTVFFMLWGMDRYFRRQRGDLLRFSLLMGVAITFKYQAVPVFFVMLFLREKRLTRIALHTLAFGALFLAELALFYPSPEFRREVLGFNAAGYITLPDFANFLGGLNYGMAACFALIAWSYFVRPQDDREEAAWVFFLGSGLCFAFFGLTRWHPSWLMFCVPFFVLGGYLSRHNAAFLMLDIPFFLVFQIVTAACWTEGADDMMLSGGILRFPYNWVPKTVHWSDLVPIDSNLCYTALVVLLLVFFVFRHPRYALADPAADPVEHHRGWLRARLIAAVAIFLIPSFAAYAINMRTAATVAAEGPAVSYRDVAGAEEPLTQLVTLQWDTTLNSVSVYTATYTVQAEGTVRLTLTRLDTREILWQAEADAAAFTDLTWAEIPAGGVALPGGVACELRVEAGEGLRNLALSVHEGASNGFCALVGGEPQPWSYGLQLHVSADWRAIYEADGLHPDQLTILRDVFYGRRDPVPMSALDP